MTRRRQKDISKKKRRVKRKYATIQEEKEQEYTSVITSYSTVSKITLVLEEGICNIS